MIHILFVPGMFGSTIEHVLRSYTKEYLPTGGFIDAYGALHTFEKEFHPTDQVQLETQFINLNKNSITTPIYPFLKLKLPEILEKFAHVFSIENKCILLYAPDFEAAEINLLFQYHKISIGVNKTLKIFYDGADQTAITKWNTQYKNWSDLQPWEFREWFSLFYPAYINEWIMSKDQVGEHFIKIANTDVLNNPELEFRKIIKFCNLNENPKLNEFATAWKQAQKYILDEFNLINKIVSATILQRHMSWNNISIIGEAIVQRKLRDIGYEIKCANLNQFPKNSENLFNLLENI